MEQGKTCTKCGEWKPFEGFSKDKNKKYGLASHCKECVKKHRQKNKEQIKEYDKQYYQKNIEQKKQYYQENIERYKKNDKQYYQKNKERVREYHKQYYQENVEQYQKQKKRYRQENKIEINEKNKQYYQKNKERISEYAKQYYQENIEQIKKQSKRYYDSEKGREVYYRNALKRRSNKNHIYFTPHKRKQILERDNWECQSCGIKVHDRSSGDWNTPDKAHIDHIIPISKGGNSEPNNLQTLCRTCNLSKHNKIELQLELF
jgi:5-methylcytosine-specific restriction endonuclease McrA